MDQAAESPADVSGVPDSPGAGPQSHTERARSASGEHGGARSGRLAGGPAGRRRSPGRAAAQRAVRANAAPLLFAAAAFAITLGLLLRFHVADRIEVLPAVVSADLRLVDPAASYLDAATWETVEDTEVVQRTEVRGSVSPGNPDWSTWEVTVDTAGDAMIGHMDRRVVVHRSTGAAVNCCGEHVDGDRAVRQAGLVLYWPAGGARDAHPFYDADIRAAPLMEFTGTEQVAGLATRRYEQTVEPTQVPGSARSVPARALGLDRSGTVTATRWVEVHRTYWIEPVSGRLVDAEEERRETLRAETGTGERMLLDASLAMPDDRIGAFVADARTARLTFLAVRTWAPAGLGGVGVLLLAAGAAAALRARRTAPPAGPGDRPEPGHSAAPETGR
ncbi:DUF3068 domain-containing protein [Nocardiopsis mangrovi]|uniref:DUF3068 domain-containing protein n=1 Tax=Nocardiopsis mangrovi TaxID=1179818 RepID=A0ABV9DTN5_9ACTN